jgi:hypothetical protein
MKSDPTSTSAALQQAHVVDVRHHDCSKQADICERGYSSTSIKCEYAVMPPALSNLLFPNSNQYFHER